MTRKQPGDNSKSNTGQSNGSANGQTANGQTGNGQNESITELVFARRLKVLRRVLGISASELDRMVGFGGGAIGRLERGNQRIYASQLFRIGEATGVGVDYFYVGLDGKAGESESVKADIDYLIKSLEAAKGGDLRGDVKIVAKLLAAELASDMVGDISDISQNPQDRKKDPEED